MKTALKVTLAVVAWAVLVSSLVTPLMAQLWPGEGGGIVAYTQFVNDPYPRSVSTVRFQYWHTGTNKPMSVELYNPTGLKVANWTVTDSGGFVDHSVVNDVHGTWSLKDYIDGGAVHWDYAQYHLTFGIVDPLPEQLNLGGDWARHPVDAAIKAKAWEIVGESHSSLEAAQLIYSHVLVNFNHTFTVSYSFRSDLELLNDLNTVGQYRGVCRSDAVILTAYSRAVGIPARIIHLTAFPIGDLRPPGMDPLEGDPHYFAEFYVLNGTSYQWVSVDGDPVYNWFGVDEANLRISELWPEEEYVGEHLLIAWNIGISIVTYIPQAGIVDSGYSVASYPGHPYRNDL